MKIDSTPGEDLPELPPTALRFEVGITRSGQRLDYTAEQMRAYALEAVAQERERCAKLCEFKANVVGPGEGAFWANECADAIRAGNQR